MPDYLDKYNYMNPKPDKRKFVSCKHSYPSNLSRKEKIIIARRGMKDLVWFAAYLKLTLQSVKIIFEVTLNHSNTHS